jgi:hypothetical protein
MNQEIKDKKEGKQKKINKNNYVYFSLYLIMIIIIVIFGFIFIKNKQNKNLSENNFFENNNDNIESELEADNNSNNENNNKITIENINSGDLLSSPVLIKGKAKISDDKVFVELRNNNHEALVKEWTSVKNDGSEEIESYAVHLDFYFKNTSQGYVAVYESEEKKNNLIEIPVEFKTID